MPRKSPEALSGAWYRAQQQYGKEARPQPPAWLGKDEAQTFREIVGSRAPDLFGPGNLELLAHYSFVCHQARRLWALAEAAGSDEARQLEAHALKFVGLAAALAGKLALLPRHQHGHRSGVLNEKSTAEPSDLLPWSDATNDTPF
jgi:hypothetical protein